MARFRKPFFRPARGLWYVQLDGKQINLGSDKEAAFKAYHGLMKQRAEAPLPAAPIPPDQRLVVIIVDEFLDWCEKHRAPDTYRWYKDRLESFCATIDVNLTADDLRPHHVQKWVDNYGVELKSGSRRNLIASVKRAMKWAEEQGYIEHSRIAHMKKPGCGRKEQVVTQEEYKSLLERYGDDEFSDLLIVTWEITPDGAGLRPRSRFAKFTNLPELQQMFRSFSDVQTAEMLELPRPSLETGKPIVIACPMSDEQRALQEQLVERYERIRKPFTLEIYLTELTALRDQLKSALSGAPRKEEKKESPTIPELAARIKAVRAAHTVEATPQRVRQQHSSSEEPITSRIRRRTESIVHLPEGTRSSDQEAILLTPDDGSTTQYMVPERAIKKRAAQLVGSSGQGSMR